MRHCRRPQDASATTRSSSDRLKQGQALYAENCLRCHGASGRRQGADGRNFMRPRPRDYRAGVFKFTTTPYGYRPRRADLLRTRAARHSRNVDALVRLLPDDDLEALVDYVLVLTHRGEMEIELALEADTSNEISRRVPAEASKRCWRSGKRQKRPKFKPLTPMPISPPTTSKRAGQAFLTKGCSKCHGEDGAA